MLCQVLCASAVALTASVATAQPDARAAEAQRLTNAFVQAADRLGLPYQEDLDEVSRVILDSAPVRSGALSVDTIADDIARGGGLGHITSMWPPSYNQTSIETWRLGLAQYHQIQQDEQSGRLDRARYQQQSDALLRDAVAAYAEAANLTPEDTQALLDAALNVQDARPRSLSDMRLFADPITQDERRNAIQRAAQLTSITFSRERLAATLEEIARAPATADPVHSEELARLTELRLREGSPFSNGSVSYEDAANRDWMAYINAKAGLATVQRRVPDLNETPRRISLAQLAAANAIDEALTDWRNAMENEGFEGNFAAYVGQDAINGWDAMLKDDGSLPTRTERRPNQQQPTPDAPPQQHSKGHPVNAPPAAANHADRSAPPPAQPIPPATPPARGGATPFRVAVLPLVLAAAATVIAVIAVAITLVLRSAKH